MTALTPPFICAALVLCVAAVAKLRSPNGAVTASRTLGIPAGRRTIRLFAGGELAIGAFAALHPSSPAIRVAVACLYALFSVVSLVLARQRAGCGCFGERDVPASGIGSLLSGTLALVAGAAVAWRPDGIGWVLGHGVALAATLLIGIAGAAYATVIAYTDLPLAWAAWSER